MLKRLWRWLLRLVVSVLVVLAIILVSDFVSHRYRPGTVLVLELNGPVPERGSVSLLGVLNTHEAALNLARRALINAQDDPRIVGLAIKVIDPISRRLVNRAPATCLTWSRAPPTKSR